MSVRRNDFITRRSPVDGLSRRNLSFWPVLAQAIAAVAPLGAMAVIPALVVPGAVFGPDHPNLLVTFGAAMGIMVAVSFCLRPMTKRMAAVSGLYSYTAKGLGPWTAIVVGWSAILGYALVAMAGIMAASTYSVQLLISVGIPISNVELCMAAIVVGFAALCYTLIITGIRISAWFTLLLEPISLLVLTTLMIVYFFMHPPHMSLGKLFDWSGNIDTLWIGIVVAVSAFVGFESGATLGGETRKPFVNVTRAITWTPIVTGLLFLVAATAQDAALADAPASITQSTTPLADLLSRGSNVYGAVLDAAIAASWLACAIASLNALARILFCMGREGAAPSVLGRAHPRFRTPATAVMLIVPVVALVPVVLILSGATPQEALTDLFTLGAYGYLGSYVLTTASLPFFLRRVGEDTYVSWILGPATSFLIVAVLWEAAAHSIREGRFEILMYLGVVLLSMVYATVLRVRSPRRLEAVGVYDETRETDLFAGSVEL